MAFYNSFTVAKKQTMAGIKLIQQENERKEKWKQYDGVIHPELKELNYGNGVDIVKKLDEILKGPYYTKPDSKGRTHKEPKYKLIDILIQASPGAPCYDSIEETKKYFDKVEEFIKEQFPNCPYEFNVHFDEKTPHCHFLLIPTDPDTPGKISCNKFIGKKMQVFNLHTELAEKTKQWNIQRGLTYAEKKQRKQYKASLDEKIEQAEKILKNKYLIIDYADQQIEKKIRTEMKLDKQIESKWGELKDLQPNFKQDKIKAPTLEELR